MLPQPSSVADLPGAFRLTGETPVTVTDPDLLPLAGHLRHLLHSSADPADHAGCGGIGLAIDGELPGEGYRLRVRPAGVEIAGGGPAGVFYGIQTFLQLLPPTVFRRAAIHDGPWWVTGVEIEDAPRFGWRGCMLDVARHFMPKADLLRFIDLLALHKLNVLHLHLTDDQGWRLEIRRYPRLTEVGSWRRESMVGSRQHERFNGRPHGGFYTQDDIREIVAYAAARFITILPEIDLPGHTQAAIAAYPRLGNHPDRTVEVSTRWGISTTVLNVADETIDFCRDVLDEVVELFPGRHISIGGDECPTDEWAALGLVDVDRLQARFTRRLQAHLASRGRRLHGWDEILEGGLTAPATVAAWRGHAMGLAAARAGHDVVSCPDMEVYLDYRQSEDPGEPIPVGTPLTLDTIRSFDPVPPGTPTELRRRFLGGQCNVWTEHADNPRAVDYLVFPRLSAFAEAVWSGHRDGFAERLTAHLLRLDALGVEYRPVDGPRPWQRRPDAAGWPRTAADRQAELAALTHDVLRVADPIPCSSPGIR